MSLYSKRSLVTAGVLCALSVAASAQQGWFICDAPAPAVPRTPDFLNAHLENQLMGFTLGLAGTITYGGTGGPCFDPAITNTLNGRIGFGIGGTGTIRTALDNNMPCTFGYPLDAAGPFSYATINVDGTQNLFTGVDVVMATGGHATGRYVKTQATFGQTTATCFLEVRGDAFRTKWQLKNNDTTAHTLSVWYGAWVALLQADLNSAGAFGKTPYIVVPGKKPVNIESRFTRATDLTGFPKTVDFLYGQSSPWGFRLETGLTADTADATGLNGDASQASEIVIGNPGLLIGTPSGDPTFGDTIRDDTLLGDTAFIMKFPDQQTAPSGTTTFTYYIRAPWARSSYTNTYAAVVDAPLLLSGDASGVNGLNPNPFNIRVWVDNTAWNGVSNVTLSPVTIKVNFPTLNGAASGLGLNTGEVASKTIPSIAGRQMAFRDFSLKHDGTISGDIPYQVVITTTQGNTTINGTIKVSATPRFKIYPSPKANLISVPWEFTDSSWLSILNLPTTDFRAYDWDPVLSGYVTSTSAERGKGHWLIYTGVSNPLAQFYSSNPQPPADQATGAPQIVLHNGWNLIGNPYGYQFPLGQVQGISGAIPGNVLSWQQLVNAGVVESFLAYWDPVAGAYRYITDLNSSVQPNLGYWVYLRTAEDAVLVWPAVFAPGLPNSPLTAHGFEIWKTQLVASNAGSMDDQNFIGSASDGETALNSQIMKPPASPVQDVTLSLTGVTRGGKTALAKMLGVGTGSQTFPVTVSSRLGGFTTLAWPNVASVPNSIRLTLTDKAGGSFDMRRSSNIGFALTGNGSKSFTITASPISTGASILSNFGILSSGSTPLFSYRLSTNSTVSFRITNGAGRVVYTASRSDLAGTRQWSWNRRDSNNATVPAGTYTLDITAATATGDLDTKSLSFSLN